MALPTVVGVGTAVSNTIGITPPFPGGYTAVADDIFVTFLECESGDTVTPPSGWALIVASTVASGTVTKLSAIWHRAVGGDTAPLVADAGNHLIGQMIVIRGCITSGNPWNTALATQELTADTSVATTAVTTTLDDCLILTAFSTGQDVSAPSGGTTGWANAGLSSVTEQMDFWGTAGLGGGFSVMSGGKATAGAVAASTATIGSPLVANFKAMMTIALKPPLAVALPTRAVVVSATAPPTAPRPAVYRSTLADPPPPPAATAPRPVIVPVAPRPALPNLLVAARTPQPDTTPPPPPEPVVVAAPTRPAPTPTPQTLRNTLVDPAQPRVSVVVPALQRPPAPTVLLTQRSTLADAAAPAQQPPPAPVIVPVVPRPYAPVMLGVYRDPMPDTTPPLPNPPVVMQALPRPPAPPSPQALRSTLADPVAPTPTATPAPVVVPVAARPFIPSLMQVLRNTLVDPRPGTAPIVTAVAPARVAPNFLLTLRTPLAPEQAPARVFTPVVVSVGRTPAMALTTLVTRAPLSSVVAVEPIGNDGVLTSSSRSPVVTTSSGLHTGSTAGGNVIRTTTGGYGAP